MQRNSLKFISSHEDLEVYQIAFDAAREIFELSNQVWLKFAVKCQYLAIDSGRELYNKYNQILGLIVIMTNNADKWWLKKS